MAKVLIVEPHPEVRELLVRIVVRLGLEAVVYEGQDERALAGIDVVLLEPNRWGGVEVARSAQRAAGARVVCVSISPPSEETRALETAAYLLKPFSLADLERAVLSALASAEPVVSP